MSITNEKDWWAFAAAHADFLEACCLQLLAHRYICASIVGMIERQDAEVVAYFDLAWHCAPADPVLGGCPGWNAMLELLFDSHVLERRVA